MRRREGNGKSGRNAGSQMNRLKISLFLLLIAAATGSSAQVKVRIFANQTPGSAVFTVSRGGYKINPFNDNIVLLQEGELAIISKYDRKLVVKTKKNPGIVCDSVIFTAMSADNSFTLRTNSQPPVKQSYSGDLQCFPDLETLVFINNCGIEPYLAGVIRAEGGSGKGIEYFKTQAIIARTYMCRYFERHMADRYNLCDNTHCQAFNGLSTDTVISRAAEETSGLVILAPDSTLVIAAFHSNCGGETSPSEDVWLTDQPYLRKVTDPYCLASRNAIWQQTISINEWVACLVKNGFAANIPDKRLLNFSQPGRAVNYTTGSISVPMRQIRSDLGLRSAFFSVTVVGDSVLLSGRGYGHGVGLCQEGAMAMASGGFDYKAIIKYYYTGVIISDVKNAIPAR